MMFWIASSVLTLFVAATIARVLLRPAEVVEEDAPDVAVYKSQLAEMERDLERGTLSSEEAERTRTEISRRLLAADRLERAQSTTATPMANRLGAIAGAGSVLALAFGAYFLLGDPGRQDLPHDLRVAEAEQALEARPSQALMEQAAAPNLPVVEAPEDYLALVDQLREAVAESGDEEGLGLLALHEARLGNYAAAREAQERLIRLKGNGATAEDWIGWADRAVAAAGGEVSPEVAGVMRRLLEVDPDLAGARYYLGLLYSQTKRPDLAFRLWRPVVEADAAGSFHTELARRQIGQAARLAGVRYNPPELRGPSLADIEAAQEMSAEDRAAMIEGMVQSLSSRLARDGGPAEEWAQLVRALGVLGRTDEAQAIWDEAQRAFADDGRGLALIRAAAESAGVAP